MKLQLQRGDITKMQVDAIVNAANTSLLGGGGVDGAIHRAGGTAILEACRKIRAAQGNCKPGEAVITTAGNLFAQFVIHTVGPVWNQGGKEKEQLLRNCYNNALQLAEDNTLKTIAFPNISTGIYKFPKEIAARIAVETATNFKSDTIGEIVFVCYDAENFRLYERLLKRRKT